LIDLFFYFYFFCSIIIIIIIEKRDFGDIMSNDCKDTLQTQNKTVRVRHSRTSKVSIRYRRRQSWRNQEIQSNIIQSQKRHKIFIAMQSFKVEMIPRQIYNITKYQI